MKKYYLFILLLLTSFTIGCSKPIALGKYTQDISLTDNYFIQKVIFNNSADEVLSFDEKKIENQLLEKMKNKQKSFNQKPTLLKIELLAIKDKDIQNENSINIHNTFAILAMFTTRVLPDTSTIEKSKLKQKLFILKVSLEKKETKLFIEIDNYKNNQELKDLFKKELFHKIEELVK
jgi:hypothetical protein